MSVFSAALAMETSIFDIEERAKSLQAQEDVAKQRRKSCLAAIRAQKGLIADRMYYFKTYPSCFVGRQAVDFALEHGHAETRQEATELLQAAVGSAQIHHVCGEHDFEDEDLFYRFREDESDENMDKGVSFGGFEVCEGSEISCCSFSPSALSACLR